MQEPKLFPFDTPFYFDEAPFPAESPRKEQPFSNEKSQISVEPIGNSTQSENQIQSQASVPVKIPKKGIPKILAVVIAIFILVVVSVFVALKLKDSNVALFGTKGEIVWWGIQNDASVYSPLIEEFQKNNPGIKIKYVRQSSTDYRERLTNALAVGKGPDVFEIHSSWPPMFRNDLSPLPASVMTNEEFSKSFYPVIATDLTQDGKIVGMPLEFDALTLFINDGIFAAAAKTPPVTWDDLRSLASELTERNDQGLITQSGVALGITKNIDYWPEIMGLMMFQNITNPGKPTGKRAEDALSFYASFKSALVWDDRLPVSTTAFGKGLLAMYFGPLRRVPEILRIDPGLRFRTVPLPQIPKGSPEDPDFSYATYWVEGVWAKSSNSADAWKFLKFLSERESLQKLNQNIKAVRKIEAVFPRPDMNSVFTNHSILGSVVFMAPSAKSFYLAYDTSDGVSGLNSQVNKLYEDLIIKWPQAGSVAVQKLTTDLGALLAKYKIFAR